MAASKITFADKVGIIAKENRINQVWDDDINEIKSKFNTNANLLDINTTDIGSLASAINTINNAKKIGFLDYSDNATNTTPLSVVGGASSMNIPNDGAGYNSNYLFPPTGVTKIWDIENQRFYFNELSLGDMVEIRLHLEVTTSSVNTAINVNLHLGSGGSAYSIPFITGANYKTVGTYTLVLYMGFYMGNQNTIDSGGVFKISADSNITYKVAGFYCKITKR